MAGFVDPSHSIITFGIWFHSSSQTGYNHITF